ncbi:MAG: sulfatase-like hydrolase/transferase [Pseudomonadota bacterium]
MVSIKTPNQSLEPTAAASAQFCVGHPDQKKNKLMTPQVNDSADSPFVDRGTRLFIVIVVLQLALHLGSFISAKDPRLLMPHVVACLQDLLLLTLFWIGSLAVCRLIPVRIRFFCRVLVLSSLVGLGLLLASYPLFLRDYLAFPVNVLATDTASAKVFVLEYLGIASLWPVAVALALGIASLLVPFRISLPRLASRIVLSLIVIAAAITLPRSSPQPFVYSLQQELTNQIFGGDRVVPYLRRPASRSDFETRLPSSMLAAVQELRADHILLIVLEGVTAKDFEDEFLPLKGGFYERVKEHAAYYRRYYATNLDSYTSLIAMLTSVQIPYRAYADESLYEAVNKAPSLTENLRNQGCRTLFISTYEHQPFVPTRNQWDRIMDRGDLPSLDGWVSLGSRRMEAATEDRAALSFMLDFIASSQKSFTLHELVYGHSPEWRAITGKTQLEYYNIYLTDLLDRLTAAQLESRTLIVVVSDHGNRSKSSDAENYRVPLFVTGPGVRPLVDDTFRSHIDLEGVIAHYLVDTALPPNQGRFFVVGSTERWVYGEIYETGDHLFLDDRTGRLLAHSGSMDPSKLYSDFQALIDEFGRRYGN